MCADKGLKQHEIGSFEGYFITEKRAKVRSVGVVKHDLSPENGSTGTSEQGAVSVVS